MFKTGQYRRLSESDAVAQESKQRSASGDSTEGAIQGAFRQPRRVGDEADSNWFSRKASAGQYQPLEDFGDDADSGDRRAGKSSRSSSAGSADGSGNESLLRIRRSNTSLIARSAVRSATLAVSGAAATVARTAAFLQGMARSGTRRSDDYTMMAHDEDTNSGCEDPSAEALREMDRATVAARPSPDAERVTMVFVSPPRAMPRFTDKQMALRADMHFAYAEMEDAARKSGTDVLHPTERFMNSCEAYAKSLGPRADAVRLLMSLHSFNASDAPTWSADLKFQEYFLDRLDRENPREAGSRSSHSSGDSGPDVENLLRIISSHIRIVDGTDEDARLRHFEHGAPLLMQDAHAHMSPDFVGRQWAAYANFVKSMQIGMVMRYGASNDYYKLVSGDGGHRWFEKVEHGRDSPAQNAAVVVRKSSEAKLSGETPPQSPREIPSEFSRDALPESRHPTPSEPHREPVAQLRRGTAPELSREISLESPPNRADVSPNRDVGRPLIELPDVHPKVVPADKMLYRMVQAYQQMEAAREQCIQAADDPWKFALATKKLADSTAAFRAASRVGSKSTVDTAALIRDARKLGVNKEDISSMSIDELVNLEVKRRRLVGSSVTGDEIRESMNNPLQLATRARELKITKEEYLEMRCASLIASLGEGSSTWVEDAVQRFRGDVLQEPSGNAGAREDIGRYFDAHVDLHCEARTTMHMDGEARKILLRAAAAPGGFLLVDARAGALRALEVLSRHDDRLELRDVESGVVYNATLDDLDKIAVTGKLAPASNPRVYFGKLATRAGE